MEGVKSILVIRFSSIGDVMLTTPLLRELAARWPGVRIDYCTKPPFAALLGGNPHLKTVYTVDDPPSGRYDLVIDLQNNLRSRRLAATIRTKKRVSYRKENWKKLLLVRTGVDLTGPYRSVVDRYREAVAGFGVKADRGGCELFPSPEEKDFAVSLTGIATPLLAVCFGAMHASKRYPPEKFAGVLSRLFSSLPLRAVLLGSQDDAPFAQQLLQALPATDTDRVIDLSGRCSLMQTAAVLERCNAVLTNDTGLMHMASAFGKTLFVIFGSSAKEFGFLPHRTPFELFEVEGLECRPCSHIGRDSCPEGHFRCMNDLSPERIASAIISFYSRTEQ
jgi:heptosyltransferase-2